MRPWGNPDATISKHFTVREALWLPSWRRMANEADGLNEEVWSRIVTLAVCHMDQIRDFIGLPIRVHCWYRPYHYNQAVGGVPGSAHECQGDWSAVDWSADVDGAGSLGKSCDIIRACLLPKLAEFNVRMENNGQDAPWIHIDKKPHGATRFFKP